MRTRVHVNLNVRDLEASVAFYETLFGRPASKRQPNYANFRLTQPALHLALVSKPTHEPAPTEQHFGIELFQDAELDGWRRRVEAAGLVVRTEEAVTCCYAVANKFWAADPDGNDWEFWVRQADAQAMHDSGTAADAAGCCAPMPMSTPVQDQTGCC